MSRTSKPWKVADGKKDLSQPMQPGFDPIAVEDQWYDWWERSGFFKPRSDFEKWSPERIAKEGQFTICLPPPNVTGSLHIGHALTNAVQDSVVRWRRMRGENVLWIPGCDHAGIATQVVVEKKLKKEEGKSRHDLGREEFVKRVWDWKHKYASTIHEQLKKTASSLDWSREFFTMDEPRAVAVTEAFCRLHEKGIIERSTRLVNWCVALQSAISDLEVEHAEYTTKTFINVPGYDKTIPVGVMYDFIYVVEGTGERLQIATTRPETILGDTAIAIHPDDERYKHLHGKKVLCPFRDEAIPIVLDKELVKMDFGTGIVKVTPAHDPNDFECGRRHKLPEMLMMDTKGLISVEGPFKGMKRLDARREVIAALKEKNLFVSEKPHAMKIGHCQRSNDIVEPYLMPQWFADMGDAAKRALDLEKSNTLKLVPKRYSKIWHHWLADIKPWCISRQLWWGHRIPAYECFVDGKSVSKTMNEGWVSGRNVEEAKKKAVEKFKLTDEQAAKLELRQDPDVLDTWFSSGLLPHSALGWPNEEHKDFKQFFPTQLLETGNDILFFWVTRMVMTSLLFLDKLPFEYVYLHAMVRDKDGQKMSKSSGNVIDPLDVRSGVSLERMLEKLTQGNLDAKEVERASKNTKATFPKGIAQCGSDALRMGLLASTNSGADVNLDISRVEAKRFFCNKLWNAVNFGLKFSMGVDYEPPKDVSLKAPLLCPDGTPFTPWDKNNLVDANSKILKSRCSGTELLKPGEAVTMPFACHWILSRLDRAIIDVNAHFEAYDFSDVERCCYSFWYRDFCDNFLEMSKPIMASGTDEEKKLFKYVLFTCLETGLRLIHPLLPFTTEELWNRLPGDKEARGPSVMIADYPRSTGWANAGIDAKMDTVQDVIHTIRSMKASYQLNDKITPDVFVTCKNEADAALLQSESRSLKSMGKTGDVIVTTDASVVPEGCAVQVCGPIQCHMLIAHLIDVPAELKKIEKKKGLLQKSIESLEKKMAMSTYEERVPLNVREENTAKLAKYKAEVLDNDAAVENLKKMQK